MKETIGIGYQLKKVEMFLTKQSQLFSQQILKKEIAYKLLEKNSAVM